MTTSCGCKQKSHENRYNAKKRIVDADGKVNYKQGYFMNFGWVYDDEAGVDSYGNRIVTVHSKWVPEEKAVLPAKELDPVANPNGIMMCSRWAQNYVEYHNVDLNKLIADADRRIDKKAEIKADAPKKRKVVPTECEDQYRDAEENGTMTVLDVNPEKALVAIETHVAPDKAAHFNDTTVYITFEGNGVERKVKAHGKDEIWIKTELSHDEAIAETIRDMAYVSGSEILGKTLDHIGENQTKYSDFATEVEYDGRMAFVHEEYDGLNHIHNAKTIKRDNVVMMDCIKYNLGVLRISTQWSAFKNRNSEAVLSIRQALLNIIRANVAYNAKMGRNERPVVFNVTRFGVVEAIVIENGELKRHKMGPVSKFIATCC